MCSVQRTRAACAAFPAARRRKVWSTNPLERVNKQYLPRGVDLSSINQAQLDEMAAELNGRHRQTLGWMKQNEAPAEVLR